jgi:HlyD family secretion protein
MASFGFLQKRAWWVRTTFIVATGAIAFLAWELLKPKGLPEGFASGNGRIEATEVDVDAKIAERIRTVTVHEGDLVRPGQLLVQMNTDVLMAQRTEAEAQLQSALVSVRTAQDELTRRRAEKSAAIAVIAQRKAELDAAQKLFLRTQALAPKDFVTVQALDDARANSKSKEAAVSAAEAQAAAADAAVGAATSEVLDARSKVDAERATIQRIQANINDSALYSPVYGRVQYRVAEPGEVLPAGGRVLNLVNLSDVYMTFFLPDKLAGQVAVGAEARIVLDAFPQFVIPATVTFVSSVAQFTPKTVETAEERQKLTFRIKAQIAPELLLQYLSQVKTGLPGMTYVRLDPNAKWPSNLQTRLPPPLRPEALHPLFEKQAQ